MKASTIWKLQAKLAVVGFRGLIYLPPKDREQIINLGDPNPRLYATHFKSIELEPNLEDQNGLYAFLHERLRLIASVPELPLFVEFYLCPRSPAPIYQHLIGFLRVLKRLQQEFRNPIICVMGPVTPMQLETPTEYLMKKQTWATVLKSASILSRAMAVPVLNMRVQVFPPFIDGYHAKLGYWREEPLFSNHGFTREYYQRVHTSITTFYNNLKRWTITSEESRMLNQW